MYLASLTQAKEWLAMLDPETETSDALLRRLIQTASQAVLGYIQRPNLARTTFTETRSGRNTNSLTLRNWPVVSISSLSVNGSSVPQAPSVGAYGWVLEVPDGSMQGRPQQIGVSGGASISSPAPYGGGGPCCARRAFPFGMSNIQIVYQAGYCVIGEAQTVTSHTEGTDPEVTTYRCSPSIPYGPWLQDDGVTLANGTALTKITSGSPSANQYRVVQDEDGGEVYYLFNVAQNNAGVLLDYSYVPFEINNAVIEMVGEVYRYQDRIGLSSKTLGGQETMSYNLKAMPDFVKGSLAPFKLSFPIG